MSNLESCHYEDLVKSGLSDETINLAGFYSVSPERVSEILGFNHGDSPGMAIPYKSTVNGEVAFTRVKLDIPPIIKGKPAKYLSPKDHANRLFIPTGVENKLNGSSDILYITEGEKKALKAVQEGLDCIALAGVWCWKGKDANGDSHPIPDLDNIAWKNRLVYIVFDSDADQKQSVLKAEKALAGELSSRGAVVKAIRLPSIEEEKIGLDDFLVKLSVKSLLQLPQHDPHELDNNTKRKESQSSRLIKIASNLCLFHDQKNEAFAFIDYESIPLRSRKIKQWLARQLYISEGIAPNTDALNQAIIALEAKAIFDGSEYTLNNRIAQKDGSFWYDMGCGIAVRINSEGWEILDAPILFQRYSHQKPQIDPVKDGDPFRIFEFLNVNEDNRLLVLVSLISYFVPDIPHPIFHPHGPHGAGKTSLFRVIQKLCDPSCIEALITPRDLTQLIQIISHHHVCLFDNLSDIPAWMSDILSQVCTGGGFSKRQLYTDDDDIIYQVKRCIGINGINLLIKKPDLMDRSVLIYLDRIDPSQRIEESKIWDKYEKVIPEILGGVFDTLAKTISIYPSVELTTLPRMADFARWGYAIAEALGYEGSEFLDSYQENIEKQNEEVIQSNTLALSILTFMKDIEEWDGTLKEAWTKLTEIAEPKKGDSTFPKSERSLRKHLERIKANLMDCGIQYNIGPRGEKGYPICFQKDSNFSSLSTLSSRLLKINELRPEHNLNQIKQPVLELEFSSGVNSLQHNDPELPVLNEHNYPASWDEIMEEIE